MQLGRRLWSSKSIRRALLGLLVGAAVCSLHPDRAVLIPFLFWSVPTHSMLMVPNEPAAIAAVQMLIRKTSLYDAALLVALTAAIGAGVACVIDQTVLQWFARKDRLRGFLNHSFTGRAVEWFRVWPFGTVFAFALLPLPFFLVRFLAAAAQYPIERYTAATMLGRIPRIFLLCVIGGFWVMPPWLVVALVVAALGTASVVPRRLVRIRSTVSQSVETD